MLVLAEVNLLTDVTTVHAFKEASDQCLHDVGDRGLKYESSSNCNSLGTLSIQYLKVGGGREGAPIETEIDYANALSNAWTARVISLSDGRPYNIW